MNVIVIKKEGINIDNEIKILNKYGVFESDDKPKLVFSFGGDGTILKALFYAIKYDIPIVPINYGKVGYMADIDAKDFEDIVVEILQNRYRLSIRNILETEIDNKKYYALNEISIRSYNLTDIEIYDNDELITSYRSDGLIISTPTGSTAYSMSCGGSIIHPSLKVINIVAIAPQYLGVRPLILPDTKLKIKSKANIFIDGKIIGKKDIIEVKFSDKTISFVEPKNKNYYEILKSKLDWRGSK